MIWRFGLTAVLIGLHLYLLPASWAQEEESKSPAKPVYLKVCGSAATDQSKTLRLLPDIKKLREGNAADLLKAIALAERRQDTSYIAQVKEIKALTVDDPLDPEIEELTTSLESMFEALKVAAETGNADWDLRLDEVRWDQLEFNELPVLMWLSSRGVGIFNQRAINAGDYEQGIVGVSTQLRCAQHVSGVPFVFIQKYGIDIANAGLESVEQISQSKDSPNLYHALDNLPDRIVQFQTAASMDAQLIRRSLPSLTDPEPPVGDDAWKEIGKEMADLMVRHYGIFVKTPAKAAMLQMSMLLQAKAELPKITAFTNDDLKKMLPEEIMARWILAFNDVYAERWKEATKLPIAQRLVKVKELQEEIDAQRKLIGLPDSPFGLFDIQLVAREFEFQRRVNFLQTIEAIRHHIATHEGQLPDSLSDLELRSPLDPLTEKPFEYSASKSIAKLRYPKALDLELPGYHSYVLKAVSPSAK